MSTRVMGMVFDGGPEDLGQHSVLLALADNADDAGVAWPGDELLARKSRLSVRQLIRVRSALEAEGWFTVARRRRVVRDGEQRYGNLYQLNLARLRTAAEAARKNRDQEREQQRPARKKRGDTVSPEIADGVGKNGACEARRDMVSPEPDGPPNDVTSEQNDMTSESKRHDMPPSEVILNEQDNFRNRHLTIIEPFNTPLTPSQARGMAALKKATAPKIARQRVAANDRRPQGTARNNAPESATHGNTGRLESVAKVMRECNVSDPRMAKVIDRAMLTEAVKTDETPNWNAIAERMIARRKLYVEEADRGVFRCAPSGIRKFFGLGIWAERGAWPYDFEELRQISRARLG